MKKIDMGVTPHFSTKDTKNLSKPLLGISSPQFLLVADKPLKLGGIPKKISSQEAEKKFGFKYSEDVFVPSVFSNYKDKEDETFTQEENDSFEQELKERLENPLNDKLVICYINDKVGYGVFANEFIKAGTIIGIYAGQWSERNKAEEHADYGWSLNNDKFRIDAKKVGGIMRFMQHMPYSFKTVAQAIRSKSSEPSVVLNILEGNGISYSKKDKLDIESFTKNQVKDLVDDCISTLKERIVRLKLCEEMKDNVSLQKIDGLAVANVLVTYLFIQSKGKWIHYFRACLDIHPGEQLGSTYGQDYWFKRGKSPEYFYKTGEIIPKEVYSKPTLSAGKLLDWNAISQKVDESKQAEEKRPDYFAHDPRPPFGSPITKVGDAHNRLITDIKKIVDRNFDRLKDYLEWINNKQYGKVLRTACNNCRPVAADKEVFDLIKVLLSFKDQIPAIALSINQNNSQGKAAIDYAALKGNAEVYSLLVRNGANEGNARAVLDDQTSKAVTNNINTLAI